jgi:hypothetical protein
MHGLQPQLSGETNLSRGCHEIAKESSKIVYLGEPT